MKPLKLENMETSNIKMVDNTIMGSGVNTLNYEFNNMGDNTIYGFRGEHTKL